MLGKTVVMAELARLLTTVLGRQVIDKTGFTRAFDFYLEFALDDVLAGLHPSLDFPLPATDPGKAASILTAIQQQLGLKLEAAKGPVEHPGHRSRGKTEREFTPGEFTASCLKTVAAAHSR